MRRRILTVEETGDAQNPGFRSVQAGSPPKGLSDQLECLFLTLEVEASDSPERLVFARRSRDDRGRRGNQIGRPQRSEPGVRRRHQYLMYRWRTEATHSLVRLRLPGCNRIGRDIDVRAVVILEVEPGHIARRENLFKPLPRAAVAGAHLPCATGAQSFSHEANERVRKLAAIRFISGPLKKRDSMGISIRKARTMSGFHLS